MINETETAKNADDLLKQYGRIKRLAHGGSRKFVLNGGSINAAILLKAIDEALESLTNVKLKEILIKKYIESYSHYDYVLYRRMNISESTFYRRLKKAQVEFAEVLSVWDLIVFNSNT